jgi:GT2 family glycosyltransferase/SAM-dependent methyltransferase
VSCTAARTLRAISQGGGLVRERSGPYACGALEMIAHEFVGPRTGVAVSDRARERSSGGAVDQLDVFMSGTALTACDHLHCYAFCRELAGNAKVLDIGCGDGCGAVILSASASRVVAVDSDAQIVKRAAEARLDLPNVAWVAATGFELPFEDGHFDIVVCFGAAGRSSDRPTFIREAGRVLRREGLLVLSMPGEPVQLGGGGAGNRRDGDDTLSLLRGLFPTIRLFTAESCAASPIVLTSAVSIGPERAGDLALAGMPDAHRSSEPRRASTALPESVIAVCTRAATLPPASEVLVLLDPMTGVGDDRRRLMRWTSESREEGALMEERLHRAEKERDDCVLALDEERRKGEILARQLDRTRQLVTLLEAETDNAIGIVTRLASRRRKIEELTFAFGGGTDAGETRPGATEAPADRTAGTPSRPQVGRSALDPALSRQERLQPGAQTAEQERDEATRQLALLGDLREKNAAFLEALDQMVIVAAAKQKAQQEITAAERMRRRAAAAPIRTTVGKRMLASRPGAALRPSRRRQKSLGSKILALGLFDAEWYVTAGGEDLPIADPLEHFLTTGMFADRDPHPLFDTAWYRKQLEACAWTGSSPFLHFLDNPVLDDLSPHPLFDVAYYLASYPDVARSGINPLAHYILHGGRERRRPHPLFDGSHYLEIHRDVAAAGTNPLVHYLRIGADQGRMPHPLFIPTTYAESCGASTAIGNPLIDYLTRASAFEAQPHPLFDGKWYLQNNIDVAAAAINPLVHYLTRGWHEGRQPHPLFAGDWYLSCNRDVAASGLNPLVHFVLHGGAERRRPHPLFQTEYYVRATAHFGADRHDDSRCDPLSHFLEIGAARDVPPSPSVSAAILRKGAAPAWGIDWPGLLSSDDVVGPIRTLVAAAGSVRSRGSLDDLDERPPLPESGYALPQALRDHLVEKYDAAEIDRVSGLMGIADRFGDWPERFERSQALDDLVIRICAADGRSTESLTPEVTIIIPVHNNLVFTLACITSVMEDESRHSIEILVGDDASTDETPSVVGRLGPSVRLVRHPRNLGFLRNCNALAGKARGRFLVVLNNDTIVLPGWLDRMVETFALADDVGLVGSKLLNADGTLQEAGGILWRDGSAWNFGRGQNPRLPEFNYVKEADYCSAASIAVDRDLWMELGGFDPVYSPAYCEDSDLAFRVRAAGRRVLYQPHSEVIHHEGQSHGRDIESGIKAYQAINQGKFLARWREVLERDHFPNAENVFAARDRSRTRPHIVFVDHYVPQWDRDAGSRTLWQYVHLFVDRGFQVTFWPDNLNEDIEYVRPMQNAGVEVIYSGAYVGQFEAWFNRNVAEIDYVFLSRPHVAVNYIDVIAKSDARILYYGVDIHWVRLTRQYELLGDDQVRAEAENIRATELYIAGKADLVLYPSDAECQIMREALGRGEGIASMPITLYSREELAVAARRIGEAISRDCWTVLFVGGFSHTPNVDGILWFATQVLPALRRRDGRYRLVVAGSNPTAEILALASEGIEILGRVSEAVLEDLYRSAGMAVAPLRYGAGVKGKVVEAFAKGVPVVGTSIALEGFPAPTTIAKVADTAEDFVQAIVAVTSDAEGTRSRAAAALELVRVAYVPDAAAAVMGERVPELLDPSRSRRRNLR